MCADSVKNGRFRFDINYRNMGDDHGLSIRILGPVDQEERELLRFDCFQKTPHFHTAVYDHNTIRKIDEEDVVGWTLDRIDKDFDSLVSSAGGDPLNETEQHDHESTVAAIRAKSEQLVLASQS